jgi:hypothetical protein
VRASYSEQVDTNSKADYSKGKNLEDKGGLRGPLTPSEEQEKKNKTFLGLLTESESKDNKEIEWEKSLTEQDKVENKKRFDAWLENTTPATKWNILKDRVSNEISSIKNKALDLKNKVFGESSKNNEDNSGDGGDE